MTSTSLPFRILLPTDGSIPALAATKHAIDLARSNNAELVILTVKETVPITPIEKLAEDTALMRTTHVDGVEYAKRLASNAKIPYEVKIRDGPVAGEIIKAADDSDVDLIVMGSSNPKGLSGFFLGHVAEVVVKSTSHSVTVVKPNQKDILAIKESAKEFILEHIEPSIEKIGGNLKFRVGLTLFIAYALGYIVYTLFGSFLKGIFSIRVLGLNIGIIGGLILIISAITIAITYNWFAGKIEKRGGR